MTIAKGFIKIPKWILPILLLAAGLLQPLPASAVSMGQTDNFEDGTTQNWVVGLRGAVPPAPPVNVLTGGPIGEGDNYLLLTSIASLNADPGNRLVVINLAQWAGDYLDAAVNFITMDANNLGATDLQLRVRVADPNAPPSNTPTNIAVSTAAVFVPAASGWTRIVFPMSPGQFTSLKGDAAAALSNVADLRIFHNPTPTFPGPTIDAQLGVDNITSRINLRPPPVDFDGDGKTDISVWRPGDGNWYIIDSDTQAVTVRQWGGAGDTPLAADFNGDGKADLAVWRPSDGNWYIINSASGAATATQWGGAGDIPLAADFDGDGKADLAVWRPSDGNWYIINSSSGTVTATQWGGAGDTPLAADFDGDGKADLAVWRPSDGNWYIINSSSGTVTATQWGGAGDIPLAADFDGDGKADLAVWRPGNSIWYIINSSTGAVTATQWGGTGDTPLAADFDGDGKADLAVWRPTDGNWYIINSASGIVVVTQWGSGSTGDIPGPSR